MASMPKFMIKSTGWKNACVSILTGTSIFIGCGTKIMQTSIFSISQNGGTYQISIEGKV